MNINAGRMVNGKKCGSWLYWDDSGTLMYEEYYITDNLVD